MENDYYLIKQTIPYLEPNIVKIYTPANKKHIQSLLDLMFGEINVYFYNDKNNKREEITKEFNVVENFNIYDYPFEKMHTQNIKFSTAEYTFQFIKIYSIAKEIEAKTLNKFFMFGHVFFRKSTEYGLALDGFFSSNLEKHKKSQVYGDDYERFIASKYKNLNYEVLENGIKKKFNDGGIDLICTKNDKLVLVQCKNWKMSNSYKINQKDLRAFIGDCYLYMLSNKTTNKHISFHFIVSHDNILTKSAEIFLEQNRIIKFKTVPFEEIN